jgi:hypothetical protein
MSLRDEIDADLAAAVDVYDQTFEWNGSDWPCVKRSGPMTIQDAEGGIIEMYGTTILTPRAQFNGTEPQNGDAIENSTLQIKSLNPGLSSITIVGGSFDAD